ncbi:MAG TPA: response regulator [Longimicrobiaceae bacterium]|nr:response regulator [Longimicrobiaceae bacterium]
MGINPPPTEGIRAGAPVSHRPPRLLLISDEPWWVRSLQSVLGSGYTTEASSARKGSARLRADAPDAILVHTHLKGTTGTDLIRTLRSTHGLSPAIPFLLISDAPLARDERVAALQAGAWDCLCAPLDAQELLSKLGTFLAAKQSLGSSAPLLDDETGVYSAEGIMRWAQELLGTAHRYDRALGCAIFALVHPPHPDHARGVESGPPSRAAVLARVLTSHGRSSDVVGRIGGYFVVLAPDTDAAGTQGMAARMLRAGERELARQRVRARNPLLVGCFTFPGSSSPPVEPADLIDRALLALQRTPAVVPGEISLLDPHLLH